MNDTRDESARDRWERRYHLARHRWSRTARWFRDEPAGQFVLVWAICTGCAGAGYYFGRRECRRG